MDLHHLLDDLGRRARVTDPPAGHRVGLGEAREVDGPLLHAGLVQDRAMRRAIHEAVVDLVGVDEQVVLAREYRDPTHVLGLEHGARRVVREAQEDRAGPRRDRPAHVGWHEPEVVGLVGRHRHRHPAREHDPRHVGDVRRVRQDDLITLVQGRAERQVDGLGDADRDQDLALRVVADTAELRGVLGDGLAKRHDPVVRRVLGLPLLDGADGGLAERIGRDEVRLTDPERDHSRLAGSEVEEPADTARGQPSHPLAGERSLGERHAAFIGRS